MVATMAMQPAASTTASTSDHAVAAAPSEVVNASTAAVVDLVAWPHHALNGKHIAAADVHGAVAAFAAAPTDVRATRVMTRTLM
jgi:hypothetical protein